MTNGVLLLLLEDKASFLSVLAKKMSDLDILEPQEGDTTEEEVSGESDNEYDGEYSIYYSIFL